MIESQIMDIIDLGDSLQKIEIYSQDKLVNYFNIFRTMLKFQCEDLIFIYFLKFFFYFQFMMIPLINIAEEAKNNDSLVKFFYYIKEIIFIQDIIKKKEHYIIGFCVCVGFCLLLFGLVIHLIIFSQTKVRHRPLKTLNILNLILQNFFLCPLINIFLVSLKCENDKHIFLNVKCWSDILHIIIAIASILFLSLCIIYSELLSIYYYRIGTIKVISNQTRINSNHEIFSNNLAIISYVIGFLSKFYFDDKKIIYKIGNRVIISTLGFILMIHAYKYVLYYDYILNLFSVFGWAFVSYFSIILILKHYLDITDIILFVIIGWGIICLILYFLGEYKIEYILTEANILEVGNIKDIEIFTFQLLKIVSDNSMKSKTLLTGLLQSLKDFFQNNPELYEKYEKFESNKMIIQKFGGPENQACQVYNIIYLIYDYYLNKSELKDDILLLFCYFLSNRLKNVNLSIYYCSKIKISGHKSSYLKYVLMEDLKDYLLGKFAKNSNNKETIKHVQMGSVILYNSYIDSFKLKIYDAACNQIDYFDILKNTTTSPKSTKNFLRIGESILSLRKEILNLWNKIITLNPFSDENEKDYMLYLETIIQDEDLAQKEEKRYNQIKMSKLSEKKNIYHSLFTKETTSIILLDGSNSKARVIYHTPNFPNLFNYLPKEILNLTNHDLMPNCVASFHKELVNDALKYSNLSYIYNKKMKNFILKSKTNGLFNINIYVKCVPNLSYGIIYISSVEKLKDNQFLIILDNNFRINAMSDPLSFANGEYNSINRNISFGLNNNIINHHIAVIIPEILKQIKYIDQKFILSKNDMDLKGILYPNINDFSQIESNIDIILERIKQNGQLIPDENINPVTTITRDTINRTTTRNSKREKESNVKEYNELIDNLREKFQNHSFSIFYKIVMKSFLNGKHVYYRLYLTKDILGNGENNNYKSSITKFNTNNSNLFGNTLTNMGTKVSSDSNIFQIPYHIENKDRAIKIQIPDNKVLVNNNENNNNENKSKQDLNNNNINDKIGNGDNIQEHISQNSFLTKSSLDSASFNKLKGRILDKNEPFFVSYLKILSVFYLLLTLLLIILNNYSFISKYKDIHTYLIENYFFNSSKLVINCVYLTGVNLKFIKYGAIAESGCLGGNCSIIYSTLFSECLDMIKDTAEDIAYYDQDYKKILATTLNLQIYIYSLKVLSNITIDTPNLLNFILSNGLRLKGNIETYLFDEKDTVFEVFEENIINCSFNYIINQEISGFSNEKRIKNLKKSRFKNNYIYFIINAICFFGIFTIILYLLHKIEQIEMYFLKKLIMFHSNNFDNYIKYLEELKKKLRSDNGEDIQSEFKNESNENNVNNENSFNNEKNLEKKLMKNATKNESLTNENDKAKDKNLKRKNRRKIHGKQSKLQQQKNEKIHIMGKYFQIFKLLLSIKLGSTLVLSMIYYLFAILLYNQHKNKLLKTDNIMSNIIGIFHDSSLVFSLLKNQTLHYENYEIEKNEYINQLKNGEIEKITLNGITYTSSDSDITLLNSTHYSLLIPSTSELYINKIGNILMPLVSGNEFKGNKNPYGQLYQLYYNDMCNLLYSDNESFLNNCNIFWSGIMKQGLEQTITQLGIELNTVLDDFGQINSGIKTLQQINDYSGALGQIEVFINFFFLNAYSKTYSLFEEIRDDKYKKFKTLLNYILAVFFIINFVLMFVIEYFIYSGKNDFNSFLNFIGIFPIQYLSEDENFYKETLKLEGDIFE